MPNRNWPYDWRRDREVVADLSPPPAPRRPAVAGPGRGKELPVLEARRRLEGRRPDPEASAP